MTPDEKVKILADIAAAMMYTDYRINAGIDRKVVINTEERDGQKCSCVKIYCYTANGRYKASYNMGRINDAGVYTVGDFDLSSKLADAVGAAERKPTPKSVGIDNESVTASWIALQSALEMVEQACSALDDFVYTTEHYTDGDVRVYSNDCDKYLPAIYHMSDAMSSIRQAMSNLPRDRSFFTMFCDYVNRELNNSKGAPDGVN